MIPASTWFGGVRLVKVCEWSEPSSRRARAATCASDVMPIAPAKLTIALAALAESTDCIAPSPRLCTCRDGSSSSFSWL